MKKESRIQNPESRKRQKAKLIYTVTFCFLTFAVTCFAKEVNFEIAVDRTKAGLGQAMQLEMTFNNTQEMPAPELPEINGFQSRYLGPSTRMSIVNGRVSSSISHIYTILPVKAGTFQIGPFKFDRDGDTYTSNAISVEVVESLSPMQNQSEQEEQIEDKDLSDRVFIIMQLEKNRVYLNEIVPVTIKLFVNGLGIRDIQFPQFNHDGFSAAEFDPPKQYQAVVGGIKYDIIEFNTTIFGLRPGELRLGPATLQCNLIVKKQSRRTASSFPDDFFNQDVFSDFFGRYEAYPLSLKSADVFVTVSPLPEENKPADFSGALGVFDFQAALSTSEVKAGDPVTLRAVVRGEGNFNTVTFPKIDSDKDFKAYEPQLKQEKKAKHFEQVLIPLNSDIRQIPALSFSFFNTQTNKYETITRGPFSLTVEKPEREEEQKIIEKKEGHAVSASEEKLGRDIIYIKDNPGQLRKKGGYLYQNKLFLGFQVIPLLLYLLTAVAQARNRKLKTDIKYARQLVAPRKAKAGIRKAKDYLDKASPQEFYDTVFETLQEYLGDKFHLPSKGITISVIDEHLKKKGINEEISAKLRDIFRECDMVRYAASQLTKENMQNALNQLEEVIDYLQRHPNEKANLR